MKRATLLLACAACAGNALTPAAASPPAGVPVVSPAPRSSASIAQPEPTAPAPRGPSVVIVAGGDVEMGRAMGKLLLGDHDHDPFTPIEPLLHTADVRFANLEGPLSDQHGETMSPNNPLVFTGPPAGADALSRAGFTIVSTANNHAWDYGKRALVETLDNLDRVGVAHVGTARSRELAYAPVVVENAGFRVAFLAVTDIWNQGPLEKLEAADYVAQADADTLGRAVAQAKATSGVDAVVVSYHGGDEYQEAPRARTRTILRAAIDAGAVAVLGHHPHVVQGVEFRSGRPILYSMGNLLMQMNRDHPWTEFGYLARLTLVRGEPPKLEVCPFRILGLTPLPFAGDRDRRALETMFFARLRELDLWASTTPPVVAPPGPDGCAALVPRP